MAELSELIGKTCSSATIDPDDWFVRFVCTDGTKYKLMHFQDCCEYVYIKDFTGDLDDLENTPILVAEERSNRGESDDAWNDSCTWTFYTFRTIKGSVDIQWIGISNGYYSESVDFVKFGEYGYKNDEED